MISNKLKSIIEIYKDRIYQFFEFDTNPAGLKNSLRHIEIVSIQLNNDITLFKSELTEEDTEFIYSILNDCYYFEKNKIQSELWRVTMLRMTWNRLICTLWSDFIENDKIELEKNLYIDSINRPDGRHIYEIYKNN